MINLKQTGRVLSFLTVFILLFFVLSIHPGKEKMGRVPFTVFAENGNGETGEEDIAADEESGIALEEGTLTEEERKKAQREHSKKYNKEKYLDILKERRKKAKEERLKVLELYREGKLYDENGIKISF